jgi:hypothetical protein
MGKRNREQAVRERRALKEEKKYAAAQARHAEAAELLMAPFRAQQQQETEDQEQEEPVAAEPSDSDEPVTSGEGRA